MQGFREERPGAAEVDADETFQFPAEHRSVAEIDAGLPQKELVEIVWLEAQAAAIEQGEISPLGPDEPDAGNALLEEFLQEIDVGLEIGQEGIEPVPPVGVGGFEADDAEDLAELVARPFRLLLERLEEPGIGGDDRGGRKARDVEGLARGDAGDRPLGELRRQGGEDLMPAAAEDEIVVDLVGEDDEIVPPGDRAEALELLARPDAPHRVVGTAEDHHPDVPVDPPFEVVEVHDVAAPVEAERVPDDAAAVSLHGGIERVVDRRLDDDALARLAEGADGVI